MADKKTEVDNLDKPGFRLLKPGKAIGQYLRAKDQVMKANGKEHTETNISKKSYVPHQYIKANRLDLKHFESKVFDKIPKIKPINKKTVEAMLVEINKKLAPSPA